MTDFRWRRIKQKIFEIHPTKDIWNLLTCVVVKFFHYCQLWYPPKDWIFFLFTIIFCHKTIYVLITYVKNFMSKRSTQKKGILKLPTCVVVRDNFTITNCNIHVGRFQISFLLWISWTWNLVYMLST